MKRVVIISYFICLSFCYNCILFWNFHFFYGMLNFISARRKWEHFKKLETYCITCMMPAKTTSNKPIKGIQEKFNGYNGSFNKMAGKHEKREPGLVTLLVPLWGPSSPSTLADHYLHLLFEEDIRQRGLPSLCCPSPSFPQISEEEGTRFLFRENSPPCDLILSDLHYGLVLFRASPQPHPIEVSVTLAGLTAFWPINMFYFPHPHLNVPYVFLYYQTVTQVYSPKAVLLRVPSSLSN